MQWPGVFLYILFGHWDESWTVEATSQASSSWQPEQAWTADATAAELRAGQAWTADATAADAAEQASAPYSLAPPGFPLLAPPSFPPPGFPVLSPLLPLPKAPAGLLPSSLEGVAPPSPSTPPPAAKAVPKPPPGDPLVALVQGQADVPLVINR